MHLADEILSDYSKAHVLKIADYACSSPKHFKELMKCFMSDEYRLSQRAAWIVSWAAKKKPVMVTPYIKDLVAQLKNTKAHIAVLRNSVRVLQAIDIPASFHGEVMNACFDFIQSPETAIAVKAFSLTALFNLSEKYPEIRPELKMIIEENWNHETAAFRSRGRKILAAIHKSEKN